ncbi:MAG TPA: LysR family transcriptional regulator [Burkholderiales bacterium]|nr:LysR family transcriptional regulator [Burkholderiales bacterium]
MDRFRSIEAFVRVAETHSFAEAARQLGVAKSVVTTRVRQLEDFLTAPLFHRNTRNVRLSEIGQVFYAQCAELIGRTNALVEQMRDMQEAPSGSLRIHALPGFVLGHLAAPLREFQERYPGIELDLVVNDAVIDPVREGFDCTLQIFSPSSEALVERRLFPVRRIFCASPQYLDTHAEPRQPKDLLKHRLGLYSRYPTRDRWEFRRGDARVTLDLRPALRTNSVHLLRDYACEDAGVVCLPTAVAAQDILAGRLRVLLPEYRLSSFWLSAVFPSTHRSTFKLKLFLETISESFALGPPWDRPLIEQGLIPEDAFG